MGKFGERSDYELIINTIEKEIGLETKGIIIVYMEINNN